MRIAKALCVFVGILLNACATPPSESIDSRLFEHPQRVTIIDYHGPAMEPFLTRDGGYLLFNNLNDPSVNTDLHYAERISDLVFQYKGKMKGVNTSALEGAPTMDRNHIFYFVSPREYERTFSTIYRGVFKEGTVADIELVPGLSRREPGIVNFDVEVSPDGMHLYFVDAYFRSHGPESADIVIAEQLGKEFKRLPGSSEIMKNVNTSALEYAATISADGLLLLFTRFSKKNGKPPAIFAARRKAGNEPFSSGVRLNSLQGFVEAPAFSANEQAIYFHRKENGTHSIYRAARRKE